MNDLVDFLRARLIEDEQAAQAATPGPWRHAPDKHWRKPGTAWFEEAVFAGPADTDATCVAGTGETDDRQSMADAAHIARHDPARALSEVEAKRRIIDEHYRGGTFPDWEYCDFCDGLAVAEGRSTGQWPCRHLRLLALPFTYHPDYQEEWRP